MIESRLGKIPTTSVRRLISRFNRSFVRPDLFPQLLRERGEREDVRPGRVEVAEGLRELVFESVKDQVELGVHRVGIELVIHGVEQRLLDPRPRALGRRRHEVG